MKIESLAATPKLIEITLDTPALLETYGEPITFHTYDIVSMKTYFDFYRSRSEGEFEILEKLIKSLILNEQGQPVIGANQDLPIDIVTEAIQKIGGILGKSPDKSSTQTPGLQQN